MQCNQSVILELSPFSILICSIGPKLNKSWINQNITEVSFPCKESVLLIPSYLQSTWFLFSNRIMCCLAADYITFLNSHSSTSSHPDTRSFGREAAAATLISFLCWWAKHRGTGHSGTSSAPWKGACPAVCTLEVFPQTRELGRDWQ